MNAPIRTFVSDTLPYPRRRDDWEGCARAAADLLAERERRYPALVEAAKMTADQAERGLRVMRAVAALWARVADRADLPDCRDCAEALGASLEEMQAEIHGSRTRLALLTRRAPDDTAARADAEYGEALWWHLQPVADGALPHLWIAHAHAQWDRADRQQRVRAA